jgi:hypothetical protein
VYMRLLIWSMRICKGMDREGSVIDPFSVSNKKPLGTFYGT